MVDLIDLPMLDVVRQHVIGCSVLAGFGTVAIALRLYGRHFSIGYGWDDLLIVLAWLFSMSLVAEQVFCAFSTPTLVRRVNSGCLTRDKQWAR